MCAIVKSQKLELSSYNILADNQRIAVSILPQPPQGELTFDAPLFLAVGDILRATTVE